MRAIYYDTETTGLSPKTHRIVELAAYDPLNEAIFETFLHPGFPIPADVTAIHGITDEMVKDAPSFSDIALDFVKFCEGEAVLIAHNNDTFDVHFLKAEYEKAGFQMPEWKFLDSLKWARRYRPDLPKHTLQSLRELFGIPENRAHRALDDVKVLHQVFSHLIDDLTLQQVYDLLNKPREIQHMPFGKYQGYLLKDIPKDYVLWLSGSGAFEKPENQELKTTFFKLGLLVK